MRSHDFLSAKHPEVDNPQLGLVEDSIPVGIEEKRLLEKAGYEVAIARY